MPNRILKESICVSDSIDKLSWFEEAFFYRLIVNCDDYGRLDARPAILRARLFPLKTVTNNQIDNALQSLRTAGMVYLYEIDGRPFLQLRTWEMHQTVRAKKSRYPAPANITQQPENICKQMQADASKCPRNPIQSESESYSYIGVEPPGVTTPPVIIFPCNGKKKEREILQSEVDEWAELYPAVDVMQELRKMLGWLKSNPRKQKTYNGVLAFITKWLAKEQDKGGNHKFTQRTDSVNTTSPQNYDYSGKEDSL